MDLGAKSKRPSWDRGDEFREDELTFAHSPLPNASEYISNSFEFLVMDCVKVLDGVDIHNMLVR